MKVCNTCKIKKDLDSFGNNKKSSDSKRHCCKKCECEKVQKYHKSFSGWLTKTYSRQKKSSIYRKHNLPNYSKEEFRKWVLQQPNCGRLFIDWWYSGFERDLIPSGDRENDYKPYSLDNIRLVTFKENCNKVYSDIKNGINNKKNKSVISIDINNFEKEYHSIKYAARKLNISQPNISKCLSGERKTCGGFKWKYKN